MKFIAHRGHWLKPEEKNSRAAFERALRQGFGIETDLRDAQQKVIIAHDMARGDEMSLEDFLALCRAHPEAGPLALNIKADGLQQPVHTALSAQRGLQAFVFDMAVPDALGYIQRGIPTFTRASEYEPQPAYWAQAQGVWLDAFEHEWYATELIQAWLNAGKQVCVVSPELHRRPPQALWQRLREAHLHAQEGLSLCTDFPQDAREYFHA